MPLTYRILIIDRDIKARELGAYHLERAGYEVDVADSVTDADGGDIEGYDMILCDAGSARLTAMELQSLVDATRRLSTKLILSSSDDDPAGIIAGLDAGADDYLMKPVSPRILVARVGSLLASRSRRKKR